MTRLAWGSATDVGRVRQANQDTFFVSDALFVVADGMGGHLGGEVASDLATTSLRQDFGTGDDSPTTEGLVRAVQRANEVVVAAATDNPDLTGMGTTLCAMAVVDVDGDERLAIVNVGDSRAYLLKDGDIEQITDDHSLVAALERQGRLTRDEAAVHPQRNILTRALGIDARVMVDSWEVRPVVGDRYLLCSDGLFNEVDESRLAATMRKLSDPSDAARELVRLANEGGGHDNITVVIVDVLPDETAESRAAAAAADRDIRSVKGETRATGLDHTPGSEPAPTRRERRAAKRDTVAALRPPRPRRFTWRVLAFVIAFVAILGLIGAAVDYYGRNTYYVGYDKDRVVIYRGRPGGVLWIQPEMVERSTLTRSTVPSEFAREIAKGKIEPTLAAAHHYLANVSSSVTQLVPGGDTGTSLTTTTSAPGPAGN
jgi:serine/threonine protein phosphatase PrpC